MASLDNMKLSEIKKALETGSKKKLNALLGCDFQANSRTSLDSPLQESTSNANSIFISLSNSFNQKMETSNQEKVLTMEEELRVLLMVSPLYKSPWVAANEFLSHCWSVELFIVCTCVSEIEQFLKEARRKWTVKPNPDNGELSGSREWLGRLAQTTVETLLSLKSKEHSGVKDYFKVLSELFRTILSLTRAIDIKTFDFITNNTFHVATRPQRIVTWLKLGLVSLPFLRPKDVETIRQSLQKDLSRKPLKIPLKDIPKIVGLSIDFAVSCFRREEDKEELSLWKNVTFSALLNASGDPYCYVCCESQVQLALKRMSLQELLSWSGVLQQLTTGDDTRNFHWIHLNLELLLFQSGPKTRYQEYCNLVLETTFPSTVGEIHEALKINDTTGIIRALDGVTYAGMGLFLDKNGKKIEIVSTGGEALYKNLFISNTPSQEDVRKRSFCLVDAIKQILKFKGSQTCIHTVLFSFALMTILYVDAPYFRNDLMQRALKTLSSAMAGSNASNGISATISIITKTFVERQDTNSGEIKELEPLYILFSDSLPQDIFCHLALTMSSFRTAREHILATSKKRLESLYMNFWNYTEEKMPFPQREHMRAGIFGLLELVRRSSWGDIELKAWQCLSNALVVDQPPLPLSERSWLYEQITDLLEDDELSFSASIHFLRALIIRSSFFFKSEGSNNNFTLRHAIIDRAGSSDSFPNQTQVDDIASMYRLILLLLHCTSMIEEDVEEMIVFATGREALLQSILSKGRRTGQTKGSAIQAFFLKACSGEEYNGEFELNLGASLSQFSCILQSLVVQPSARAHNKERVSRLDSFPSMQPMLEKILVQETKELQYISTRDNEDPNLPDWLETSYLPSGVFDEDISRIDPSVLSTFKASILDFGIELLFSPQLPINQLDDMIPLSQRIVLTIGCFLQSKLSLIHLNRSQSEVNHPLLTVETINKTAVEFFAASSVVIENALLEKVPVSEMEDLLDPVLHYCEALASFSETSELNLRFPLLERIWALYQVIGSEKASIFFISYLEGCDLDSTAENDNSICSLRTIRSGEDVDKSIQNIRLHLMLALKSCLSNFDDSDLVESSNSSKTSDVCVTMLLALSKDLQIGLGGKSGGLTPDLYIAYVTAIEECANVLHTVGSSHTDLSASSLLSFMKVQEKLCNILTVYPLNDAAIFKTTYLVASVALPSMCRDMLRQMLVNASSCPSIGRVFSADKQLLFGTFSDSFSILTRWSALRDPNSMPWADIAGSVHFEDSDMDDSTSDNESIESSSKETFKIRMGTKETWSWALSCTLLSIEEKWRESFRIMVQTDFKDSQVSTKSSSLGQSFITERGRELMLSLESVCKFFIPSSPETQTDTKREHAILEMLATNLPSAPRLRLCSVLKTVLQVLNQATDEIHNVLMVSQSPLNQLGFMEAACCISAWLSKMDTDLSIGICRWQSILQKKQRSESSTATNDTDSLLERISSLVSLLCETERNLRRLSGALQQGESSDIEIFEVLFNGGLSEMSQLVQKKHAQLMKAIPSDRLSALPDFPESDDAEKKKRTRPDLRGKRKRSRVTRSRNRVVDMFLNLDQDIEGQGRKGEMFADLEDFLVEG